MDQQLEILQRKYEQLFNLTLKMRHRQKEYFKHRVKTDLEAARKYERGIDQILRNEIELRKSGQLELF